MSADDVAMEQASRRTLEKLVCDVTGHGSDANTVDGMWQLNSKLGDLLASRSMSKTKAPNNLDTISEVRRESEGGCDSPIGVSPRSPRGMSPEGLSPFGSNRGIPRKSYVDLDMLTNAKRHSGSAYADVDVENPKC